MGTASEETASERRRRAEVSLKPNMTGAGGDAEGEGAEGRGGKLLYEPGVRADHQIHAF